LGYRLTGRLACKGRPQGRLFLFNGQDPPARGRLRITRVNGCGAYKIPESPLTRGSFREGGSFFPAGKRGDSGKIEAVKVDVRGYFSPPLSGTKERKRDCYATYRRFVYFLNSLFIIAFISFAYSINTFACS
jgi:hypothetical protein